MSGKHIRLRTVRQNYKRQLDILHQFMMSHSQAVMTETGGNVASAAPLLLDRLAADDRYCRAYAVLERLEAELARLQRFPDQPSLNPNRRKARGLGAS